MYCIGREVTLGRTGGGVEGKKHGFILENIWIGIFKDLVRRTGIMQVHMKTHFIIKFRACNKHYN